ncbi:MAG: Rv2732c family membrane protein [Pseudonocardiaceae bacterium]
MTEEKDRMDGLRAEIDEVGRAALRRVDLGVRATVVAGAVTVLLLAMSLPWTGSISGWEVLRGTAGPAYQIGLLPRLFGAVALAFGVGLSTLALLTRRWGLVWASALGCGYCVLDGIWAIWSRQTAHSVGPGIGLILAVLCLVMLAAQWCKLAVSRR